MVRGTYEAFTSLDVWANIHVYGKQPFVLNVTVLFQICLLPGSSQHKNSSFDRYSVAFVLSTWFWSTDDEHDDETDAHFNAMGERFALPLRRSVLPCLQMRHLPEPSEWVRWRFERLGNTFYKLTFSGSCIKDGLGAVICQVHTRIKADWRLCSMMIELIRKYCEGYSSSTGLTYFFLLQGVTRVFNPSLILPFNSFSIFIPYNMYTRFFRTVVSKCHASALWTR